LLTVSGCSTDTVANIIQGGFLGDGSNHNKPVFKKEGAAGNVTVLIYFWDDRDGPNFSGWWFGPKVGGDQVWAYNSNKSSLVPPSTGWRVPWDGPVDESLRVVLHGPGGGGGGGGDSGRSPMLVPPRDGRQQREEEDRRRRDRERDEYEQRRKDDDRRRREEEDRRRREEEDRRRRQREEEERRREEEQRRREAEAKRRREEEERRRTEEAERRRKEEERRRAEEEQRKRETAAALAVRKVIQRVRVATPESFDELRSELEEALAKNLEAMGPHGNKVSEEAEQTLRQAQRRIEEINEKRAEDERRRIEEEKRREEEQKKVEQIVKEAAEHMASGEEKIKVASDAAASIPEGKEATPESIVSAVDAASKVYEESTAALEKLLEWFNGKKQELTENRASRTNVMDIGDMIAKLDHGKYGISKYVEKGKNSRDLAARRAAALKKTQERRSLFEARDLDKDGKLSQDEVVAFSKEVHSFEVPSEVLAKIMLVLEPVTFEKFHALHQKVAIAKIEVEAREKRAKLDAARAAFQKIVDEIEQQISGAEAQVAQAETDAKPLARDMELPATEMKEIAEKAEKLIAQAEEGLTGAAEGLKRADDECAANKELKFDGRSSMSHWRDRTKSRLDRVLFTVKRAADQAVKKAAVEVDAKLTEAVASARKHMVAEGKTPEQLFEGIGGALDLEKFRTFVKGLPDFEISETQSESLFSHVAQGSEKIDQEKFLDFVRLYYKVVRGTVFAEGLSIKTKTIRRLEGGELLECLEGPSKDDTCGVQRVKCKALSDGVAGWVTLQGNQGTPFLVQDGNFLSVRERLAAEKAAEEKRREAERAVAAAEEEAKKDPLASKDADEGDIVVSEEEEDKPAGEKPAEEKSADEKPSEEKPAEDKPGEDKAAEEKPVEEKAADVEEIAD